MALLLSFVTALLSLTSKPLKAQSDTIKEKPSVVLKVDTASELLIYKSYLFEIYVEKSIYFDSKEKNFLMKFTINNIYDSLIGANLEDFWKVIYPGKWGFYKVPFREVTDDELTNNDFDIDKSSFFKKYRQNGFSMIKPGEKLEYFRELSGSGAKIEPKNKGEYLIVSFDGILLITDGNMLDSFTLNNIVVKSRFVVLATPLKFKTIPLNALIIKKK